MTKPITVILPVYNGMKYLEASVSSVLQQSFTDFEFLVVDDRSSDGSYEYLCGIKDQRLKLFRNPINKGLFYNLNFMIKASRSPLIKLWSQDDIMHPSCLEQSVAFHNHHPEIGFSYSGCDYIDGENRSIQNNFIDGTPKIISSALHARIAFFTGSIAGNISNVTLSKAALDKAGLFNEGMKISGDFDMWVRLAKDHPVGFIKENLIQLRNHAGQLSRQGKYYVYHLKEDIQAYNYLLGYVSVEQAKEGRRLLRNHKLLFYYTLMVKAFLKGQARTGISFFKMLNSFDNILFLSWYFLKNRVIFRNKTRALSSDNTKFIYTEL